MGSHPDALILAPLTEGGRTLSNVDTPNELSGSTGVSGSGSGSMCMGSSSTGIGIGIGSGSSRTTSGSAGSGSSNSSNNSCSGAIAAAGATLIGCLSAKIKCAPPLEPQTLPVTAMGVGANGAAELGRPDGVGSSAEIIFTAGPPRSTGPSSSGSMTGKVSSKGSWFGSDTGDGAWAAGGGTEVVAGAGGGCFEAAAAANDCAP
mmetsp:Transcript_31313/g.65522  ORF Transcript_31313/g.65522 Transcript_31313/m.65522 type:complete len:204 (-) Transcript_31313:727-1338(-)